VTGPTEPSSSAVETAESKSVAADYKFAAADYKNAAEKIRDSNSSYMTEAGYSKFQSPVAADRTNASCHG